MPRNRIGLAVSGMCVGGASIGWIAGLSVSPVVGILLPALLGAGLPLVAAVGALRTGTGAGAVSPSESDESAIGGNPLVAPVLLGSFCLGLALGISIGILARTRRWLEPSLEQQVRVWKSAGFTDAHGQLSADVRAALIQARTTGGAEPASPAVNAGHAGVLTAVSPSLYEELLASKPDRRRLMRESGVEVLELLADAVPEENETQLVKILEELRSCLLSGP